MNDTEFMEEMRRDAIEEANRENQEQYLMSSDWDYAFSKVDINEDSTLKEFETAYQILIDYGWNIDRCYLLGEIL